MRIKKPETKTCKRCKASFECHAKTGQKCWCSGYALSERALTELKTKYHECLCQTCIAAYAKKDEIRRQEADRAPRKAPRVLKYQKKGLIIVYTGGGKGKSTAAYGMVLRSLGHGYKVAMVQFMKGKWKTGEQKALKRFGKQLAFFEFGDGFTWETKDFKRDVQTARRAWQKSLELIRDKVHPLVVLDEINYCMKYNFLDPVEILKELKKKPAFKHVILTGNGAPQLLIDAADLVTEVRCVKHPYDVGILAQPGIEY